VHFILLLAIIIGNLFHGWFFFQAKNEIIYKEFPRTYENKGICARGKGHGARGKGQGARGMALGARGMAHGARCTEKGLSAASAGRLKPRFIKQSLKPPMFIQAKEIMANGQVVLSERHPHLKRHGPGGRWCR